MFQNSIAGFYSTQIPGGGRLTGCTPRCTQDPVGLRKPQGICSVNLSEQLNPSASFFQERVSWQGSWPKHEIFFCFYFVLNLYFVVFPSYFIKFLNGHHKHYFQCFPLFLFLNLFIWLHRVLVAAGILLCCGTCAP